MNLSPLIRLYPRRWRDRYGDEYEALLDAIPPSPRSIADVVRGAVLAHGQRFPTGGSDMAAYSRLQAVASAVALLAILPALAFLAAALVASSQSIEHQPSAAAHTFLDWVAAQPTTFIAAILLAGPILALALGSFVLWRRMRADEALRADVAVLAGVLVRLARRPTVVVAAFAVVAAAGTLVLVVHHMIVD
jgi:hypothetical protein